MLLPLRTRVSAGEERQIKLVDAEAVTADAFLVDHVAHGKAVVGLVGEQHVDGRIAGLEGGAETAQVVAQLALAQDIERRAEGLGQLDAVAAFDPQVAVGADADELGEVFLEARMGKFGRGGPRYGGHGENP